MVQQLADDAGPGTAGGISRAGKELRREKHVQLYQDEGHWRRDLSRERDWGWQGEGLSSGVLGTLLPCGLQLKRSLLCKELLFNRR